MASSALILAGHGSHISPNTAGLVWEAVDALRRLNVADEVTAAFWKELPSFATVMDGLLADDVTIVPLFTAQGYFTRTVIPAEMGIQLPVPPPSPADPRVTQAMQRAKETHSSLKRIKLSDRQPEPSPSADDPPKAKTLRYAGALGEHPRTGAIVRSRIEAALASVKVPLNQIAVALIGHSTRRNPESRKATEAHAILIRSTMPVREVVAVFLDDTPSIPDVYALTTAPFLIAVPYFLAAGSHTTLDVPAELGLDDENGESETANPGGLAAGFRTGVVNGRKVIYTPPVGSLDEIVEMALDLAREAGAPLNTSQIGTAWDSFPRVGRELAEELLDAAPVSFGQLWITLNNVRHIDNTARDDLLAFDDPAGLRRYLREAPFRPLATSDDLPLGWNVAINGDSNRLQAVIETAYPGVLGTTRRVRRLGADAGAWESVIARQTGQYRALGAMEESRKAELAARVCGRCVQSPVWAASVRPEHVSDILCREPCNVWLSAAVATSEGKEEE